MSTCMLSTCFIASKLWKDLFRITDYLSALATEQPLEASLKCMEIIQLITSTQVLMVHVDHLVIMNVKFKMKWRTMYILGCPECLVLL